MTDETWTWSTEQVIPSDTATGMRILDEIRGQLEALDWDPHDVFGVRLALDEALVNAIKHGNRQNEKKQVRLSCKLSPDRLWIEVADEGPGFDPAQVPDCTRPENLERPCGRGIMLMRCFMSRVEYNAAGNSVIMEKRRNEPPQSAD